MTPADHSGWTGELTIAQGAEAILEAGTFLGRPAVLKHRRPKGYRHPELETTIRSTRTKVEARALRDARGAGVRTPAVLDADPSEGRLVLELVEGPTVRAAMDGLSPGDRARVARALGASLGALHAAGMVHGDPTTSNFIIEDLDGEGPVTLAVLDISLGGRAEGVEERGVDLRLLSEAFESTHHVHAGLFDLVLEGYAGAFPDGADEALERMDAIAARGRYVSRVERRR
ncbi:MAG: Kae1-associated serine/threonine protein kinase [Thermoplasmata archaeon]|nr:MAG: Kae1-associated serine/threonine protein kinase [Thermoplasmata archaeon]